MKSADQIFDEVAKESLRNGKIIDVIRETIHRHTEQYINEFAERVKKYANPYGVDSLRDELLSELKKDSKK